MKEGLFRVVNGLDEYGNKEMEDAKFLRSELTLFFAALRLGVRP